MSARFPVVFCPSCKHEITVDEHSLNVLQDLTLPHCPLCKKEFPWDEVLRFAKEAYSWFALTTSSEDPRDHTRRERVLLIEFPTAQVPDILYFFCSIAVSGIIGNVAYDAAKKTALRLWRAVKRARDSDATLLLEVDDRLDINLHDEEVIIRVLDVIQDYCKRRLTALSIPRLGNDPTAFPHLLALLRRRQAWSSRELAEQTELSRQQVREVLKVLGATYNRSAPNRGKWTIDPDLLPQLDALTNSTEDHP